MNGPQCPSRQLTVEVQRRQIQQMSLEQLRGVADSLVVTYAATDTMLRRAMGRIAELELQQSLIDVDAIARQLHAERKGKLFGDLWIHSWRWLKWCMGWWVKRKA
jgi:hypothetical protein